MNKTNENSKLDWMYKGEKNHVDKEEYLLGRSVDKTFEQVNNEEKEKKLGIVTPKNHVEHECIPPSIRDFHKIVHEQVDLSAKLQEDPLVAIKKQEEEARRQFLQNPIQLKKLQDALNAQERKKNKKRRKKNHSDSEEKLNKKLTEKLKNLKGNSLTADLLKPEKKKKKDHLNTILIHKFNQFKDKLSQKDMDDILAGRISDTDDDLPKNNRKRSLSSSSSDISNNELSKERMGKIEKLKYTNYPKRKQNNSKQQKIYNESSSENEYERRNRKKKYGMKQECTKSNSSDGRKEKRKNNENKRKNEKNKNHNSSSSETDVKSKKQKTVTEKYTSEDNLDKIILEKLRMIRNSKPDKPDEISEKKDDTYSRYDSENDEFIYKKKSFGLVNSDGTRIPLKYQDKSKEEKSKKLEPPKDSVLKKNQNKKLSDKEKEALRKQMMVDAVKRDKERSDNLQNFRRENKLDESKIETFDKNFIHRELSKGQHNLKDVESRIKSKLNNIQRSSQHMNFNFSKRS